MTQPSPAKGYPNRAETALFGLAYYVRKDDGQWALRPRWKILAILSVSLVLLVYLSAAAFMFWMNRYYRECEATSFGEMMLYVIPNRIPFTQVQILPEFINKPIVNARLSQQAKLGDMLFENRANVYDVMAAARLSPKNLPAQMAAAQVLMDPRYRINRIEDAFDTLDAALEHALDNKNFFLEYAQLCFQYDQDRRVIATAEKFLENPDLNQDVRVALATSYAEALFLRGELSKSNEILEKYDLLKTLSGVLLASQIIWENGEKERAITFLKKISTELKSGPGSDKVLYSLAKLYWEDDRKEEAAQTLGLINILQPSDFRSLIYQLPLLAGEHNQKRLENGFDKIIQHFGANENAMLALGSYAADQGNVALQDRIYNLAIENRFNRLANFRLLRVETLLMSGRTLEASKDINELFTANPPWLKNPLIEIQFEALRMLAYYSNNQADLGLLTFNNIISKNTMSVAMMVSVARRLQKINRIEEAKALLDSAYTRNHNHLGALLELVKISLSSESTRTLGEYIERLIDTRRPPRYVLQSAYDRLASDRFIFTPNRDKLLEEVSEMLRTRVLPANDMEKGWPSY